MDHWQSLQPSLCTIVATRRMHPMPELKGCHSWCAHIAPGMMRVQDKSVCNMFTGYTLLKMTFATRTVQQDVSNMSQWFEHSTLWHQLLAPSDTKQHDDTNCSVRLDAASPRHDLGIKTQKLLTWERFRVTMSTEPAKIAEVSIAALHLLITSLAILTSRLLMLLSSPNSALVDQIVLAASKTSWYGPCNACGILHKQCKFFYTARKASWCR